MVNYREYIRSEAWKAVKIRYLKSRMPKCCGVCGTGWNNTMVFHHKTYKRLGRERLMDIVPVCRACHERVHEVHERNGRRDLWRCLKIARAEIRKD